MNDDLANTPTPNDILDQPKAVIYCRVSTLGQTKRGDGLGSQEATCRQYAERMGYQVIEVFTTRSPGRWPSDQVWTRF